MSQSRWQKPSGQLGVDDAIGGSTITGPVLSRRLEAGQGALRRLPHLSTYDRRERAISTLVTPLALHGVAVASVTDPDLWGLGTALVRALPGATRRSQAKEIVFSVLAKGRRITTVMHTRYKRMLWLARTGHPSLHPGHLGIAHSPAKDRPGGASAPHGGHPGVEPA